MNRLLVVLIGLAVITVATGRWIPADSSYEDRRFRVRDLVPRWFHEIGKRGSKTTY
jgi:hypothetical protein